MDRCRYETREETLWRPSNQRQGGRERAPSLIKATPCRSMEKKSFIRKPSGLAGRHLRKIHPLPMHLNMGTIIVVKDDIPDKLRDSQALSCDERITIRAHRDEIRLSKSRVLRIHER